MKKDEEALAVAAEKAEDEIMSEVSDIIADILLGVSTINATFHTDNNFYDYYECPFCSAQERADAPFEFAKTVMEQLDHGPKCPYILTQYLKKQNE